MVSESLPTQFLQCHIRTIRADRHVVHFEVVLAGATGLGHDLVVVVIDCKTAEVVRVVFGLAFARNAEMVMRRLAVAGGRSA